jgi:hypothetical protein
VLSAAQSGDAAHPVVPDGDAAQGAPVLAASALVLPVSAVTGW